MDVCEPGMLPLQTSSKNTFTKGCKFRIKTKFKNLMCKLWTIKGMMKFKPCVSTTSFFFVLPLLELSQLTWKNVNSKWCFSCSWVGNSILICKEDKITIFFIFQNNHVSPRYKRVFALQTDLTFAVKESWGCKVVLRKKWILNTLYWSECLCPPQMHMLQS